MTASDASLQPFEVQRLSRGSSSDVHVGDWYWVKHDDEKWDKTVGKNVKIGEHERLMCVNCLGSNFVGFTGFEGRSEYVNRIHIDEFFKRCRPEPKWRDVVQKRMDDAQQAIRDKTKELIEQGRKLCLISPNEAPAVDAKSSLLPAVVSADPKKYKMDLVRFQGKMPAISKKIEELGEDLAGSAKNMALSDLVKLEAVKEALEVVEDRIFTIELYCGILEEVVKIADGEPAPIATPVTIRQQMLYMDEETLFDYQSGGMDFNKVKDFDKWVVKPENLNRLLPEQRGVVAFRVRRFEKDYGPIKDFATAWAHMQWADANKQTYLLIRNGGQVYRIVSEVNFTPRLIPMINEIGEDQFRKIDEKWVWEDDPKIKGLGGTNKRVKVETKITPDSIEYDDHVKKVESLLKHYNRIVILIQGLLDRSMVFHPHPTINLRSSVDMEKWIVLIRDEERALPNNKVNWEEYQKQLNSSLRKGKWIYIDPSYDEGYENGENPNWDFKVRSIPRRRGWAANRMPDLCKVDSVKRDGSAVRVSWPWGKRSKSVRGKWIESEDRPGWGHYEWLDDTDRMCHEWVPIIRVLNVSDYHLGDYKMFLCDRALQGAYLKWAKYLLTAEDWARDRANGLPPEKDEKTQVRI